VPRATGVWGLIRTQLSHYHGAGYFLKSLKFLSWARNVLLLQNSQAHYNVHRSPLLSSIHNYLNPAQTFTSYSSKLQFHITLLPMARCPSDLSPSNFSTKLISSCILPILPILGNPIHHPITSHHNLAFKYSKLRAVYQLTGSVYIINEHIYVSF